MTAPQLNSVHLDLGRRDDFRRARELLVRSRGQETVQLQAQRQTSLPVKHHSFAENVIREDDENPATQLYLVYQSKRVLLKFGFNTIGRFLDNDVVVEDPLISRRHAAVLVHANRSCELHDMASKNGTFLNGNKVNCPTRLHLTDDIQVGSCHLKIEDGPAKSESPDNSSSRTSILPVPALG